MNKKMITLILLISGSVFARSPKIQDFNPTLQLSYPGAQVIASNFGPSQSQCPSLSGPVACPDEDYIYDIQFLTATGKKLTGYIAYTCHPIDDGAYGNIDCAVSPKGLVVNK